MTLSEQSHIENEHVKLKQYLEDTFYLSERIDSFNKNKLYTLEIELLRRCNLECIYCYNTSAQSNRLYVDPNKCKNLLLDAARYGIKEIYWLGGETLLYPHIEDILHHAKNLGFRNVVFTNGTFFDPDVVKLLKNTTEWICIHLDSIDFGTFSKLHQISNESSEKLFNSILEGIDILLNSGYPSHRIRFNVVLTQLSLQTLDETLSWAIRDRRFCVKKQGMIFHNLGQS